jgi:hypothetical protein
MIAGDACEGDLALGWTSAFKCGRRVVIRWLRDMNSKLVGQSCSLIAAFHDWFGCRISEMKDCMRPGGMVMKRCIDVESQTMFWDGTKIFGDPTPKLQVSYSFVLVQHRIKHIHLTNLSV